MHMLNYMSMYKTCLKRLEWFQLQKPGRNNIHIAYYYEIIVHRFTKHEQGLLMKLSIPADLVENQKFFSYT